MLSSVNATEKRKSGVRVSRMVIAGTKHCMDLPEITALFIIGKKKLRSSRSKERCDAGAENKGK